MLEILAFFIALRVENALKKHLLALVAAWFVLDPGGPYLSINRVKKRIQSLEKFLSEGH